MNDSSVAAIIVLFHPQAAKLSQLIESVASQVAKVFVIDNTPGASEIGAHLSSSDGKHVRYIPLGDNLGIAKAQNVGLQAALAGHHSHVLLLDQDSVVPSGMVDKLLCAERTLIDQGKSVGSVGPLFVSERTGTPARVIRHGLLHVKRMRVAPGGSAPVETDYIISSGSLISADALAKVGMMREDLFIDWVDIEWGLRARSKGLSNFVVPSATMGHSLGDDSVSILGAERYLHGNIRNYYIVRNATYLLRQPGMGWRWRSVTALKVPQYLFFYTFTSRNKWEAIRLLCKGLLDGLRGKLGRLELE